MARDILKMGLMRTVKAEMQKPKVIKPKVVKQATVAHKLNVLFILVDTLRASHMDLNGYERPTMPNLRLKVLSTSARLCSRP